MDMSIPSHGNVDNSSMHGIGAGWAQFEGKTEAELKVLMESIHGAQNAAVSSPVSSQVETKKSEGLLSKGLDSLKKFFANALPTKISFPSLAGVFSRSLPKQNSVEKEDSVKKEDSVESKKKNLTLELASIKSARIHDSGASSQVKAERSVRAAELEIELMKLQGVPEGNEEMIEAEERLKGARKNLA